MAFAGGPFNSFVLQSTAAMVPVLREDPGSAGLVTTVSGLLTKPGLAVWSTEAHAGGTLSGDLGAEAGRRTETIELDPHPSGRLVVETSTTFTDDDGPRGIAFARGADDRRSIISTRDPSLVESFSSVVAIGTTISAP
jgi:acetyl-CoA C-acetyltransferase